MLIVSRQCHPLFHEFRLRQPEKSASFQLYDAVVTFYPPFVSACPFVLHGGAERYRRLYAFLETHPFIIRKDYSGIIGLLRNKALNDLNLLVKKGLLTTLGQGAYKVYVRL